MLSNCPEAAKRAAMTDAEFWDLVFGMTEDEERSWNDYRRAMEYDVFAIHCARCGLFVEVDDPENRERDAFCDDCASEHEPDLEETA